MKKILMFVAALVFAAGVNAATVAWSGNVGSTYSGYAYQFFIVGQNDASIEAVTAALTAGNSTSSMAFGSGTVAANGGMNNTNSGKSIDPGTYVSFMVLFDNVDASKATSYVVLSGASGQTQSPGTSTAKSTFKASDMSGVAGVASNWASIGGTTPTPPSGDIPEPTSGLLLVVGGALLALRRKQK